jgi:hypothetical protein
MNFITSIKRALIVKFKIYFKLGSEPDFFILGAQKAGTTSIFNYIESCSTNFVPPRSKELGFFSENYNRGIALYKSLFPSYKKSHQISGEATPDYLFFHKTPKLVKKHYPNSKFIVMLRDPIERAYSQYNHQNFTDKTVSYDPLSFSNAIRIEEDRFQISDKSNFFYEYKYYSYKKRGLYQEQIKNWLKYFPKESFIFIDMSELNDTNTIKKIFDFIGLEYDVDKVAILNEKYNSNPYNGLFEEDVNHLLDFYRGKFEHLEVITGRSFPWLEKYLVDKK